MDVTLRITNIPSAADAARKRLTFTVIDGSDIVFKSQLSRESPLNEHLVWFWGMLQGERRYLKSLAAQGAIVTVHARGNQEPLEIKSNGAEMLHLLGATLRIER
jgi:hypothetical protein